MISIEIVVLVEFFFALDSWERRAGFKPCEIQSVTDITSKPY